MGLSIEDYKLYLNSFINQSIVDYDKLLKGDDKAIKNLSTLALTLKIPQINLLLLKIKNLPKEERIFYIDEYYTKLTLLTLREVDEVEVNRDNSFPIVEPDIVKSDDKLDSTFTEVLNTIEMKEKPKPKTVSKPKESVKVVSPKKVEEPELDFSLKRDDKLDDLSLDGDFSDFENLLSDFR